MNNLVRYLNACIKCGAYSFNCLYGWIRSYPDMDSFSDNIQPKMFRDFLNGISSRIEHDNDRSGLINRLDE